MTDAYLDTTILADILLKPHSAKKQRATDALARFQRTLLPVYAIKEFKAGALYKYAYLHDKLVLTKSFAKTHQAIADLAPKHPYKNTAEEAMAAAAHARRSRPDVYVGPDTSDEGLADSLRLALASLILRSWSRRRKLTSAVVDDLPCYVEAAPKVGRDGYFDLRPMTCEDEPCCLGPKLSADQARLVALRNAIPENSGRNENDKRRHALKKLIKRPDEDLDRESCRDLGDAIFAFFCPKNAVILTTNLRDHEKLAQAVGKDVESP